MASAVVDFAKLVPEGTVIRAVPDGYGGAIFVTDRYVHVEFEVVDDETDAVSPPVRLPHPDSRPLTDGSQTSD